MAVALAFDGDDLSVVDDEPSVTQLETGGRTRFVSAHAASTEVAASLLRRGCRQYRGGERSERSDAIAGRGVREARTELDDLVGESRSRVERSRVRSADGVDRMQDSEREGSQLEELLQCGDEREFGKTTSSRGVGDVDSLAPAAARRLRLDIDNPTVLDTLAGSMVAVAGAGDLDANRGLGVDRRRRGALETGAWFGAGCTRT